MNSSVGLHSCINGRIVKENGGFKQLFVANEELQNTLRINARPAKCTGASLRGTSVDLAPNILSRCEEEKPKARLLELHRWFGRWNGSLLTNSSSHIVGECGSGSKISLPINMFRNMKRKVEVTNCDFTPSRKQHITEEKMAACMQSLSLEHQQIRGPVKNENDDSDFEDDSDIDVEEIEEKSIDPVYELHVDLRDNFRRLTNILPECIVDDIAKVDNSNLAVVPYVPRDAVFFNSFQEQDIEDAGKLTADTAKKEAGSEYNEMFAGSWDSDSDNDFMLE